jgi:outer membrane protein TolC
MRRFRSLRAAAAAALLLGSALTQAEEPPAAPSGTVQQIDLATALRLAGLNNLDLALVRTAEQQAVAANDAATLRFVPSVTVGETFAHRSGADQQTSGAMLEVDKSLYRRGATVGLSLELGDAIFSKLAARQLQAAAAEDVQSQHNDTLLAAAGAYFDLVNAVAERDIAAEAVQISQQYQSELERAVAIGLTNRSEALRVAVQTQQAEVTLRGAEAQVRTSGARLDTVLRLDPAIVLAPAERLVVPPTLVTLDTPLTRLLETALRRRPELKASAAAVDAAEQ